MSIEVKKITDPAFRKYARVITDYDCTELIARMEATPMPGDEVIYIASDPELEALPIGKEFNDSLYGGMPAEIGYCNGNNSLLNAVEYHRSSEYNIACTDAIMLFGCQQDIEEDNTYDTSKIEAFLLPAGTMIECYATTLHYAPCGVGGESFRVVIVLPAETNYDLEVVPSAAKEDRLLTARNKWLIAHPDAKIEGAYNGLKGENISVL